MSAINYIWRDLPNFEWKKYRQIDSIINDIKFLDGYITNAEMQKIF